uniref:Mediator complex subunit Med12 LCEWAV-domain domain-containing protein n=1 Tax=Timema monikensis TaxID=170555 RepID=A0A7R9HSZ3_9NEOP|nr:unnamed protein product [Timema monikensis]
MDSNNCLDTLYSKIFTVPGNKDNGSAGASDTTREIRADFPINHDEAVVQTLCEWAVSHQRSGEHRAMAVSKLLEKRQGDLCAAVAGEGEGQDDKDSVCSGTGAPLGLPVFQNLLMKFLDNDAPVLDDNPSPQNRAMFTNLIHLFAELIRHDIFSHDVYMCTLISRGDLNTGGPTHKPATPGDSRTGVGNPSLQDEDGSLFPAKLEVQDHGRGMDYDDSKIDDDLDKLLQHIKEEQQNSMLSREGVVPQDAPDSPKDDGVPALVAPPIAAVPLEGPEPGNSGETRSRHLLYTTHFPLPQDEPYTMHDCNQRHVLLYGVGRVRDEARHTVKKMTKEVCKLFGKKFSIDVAEVDPSRKGYDSTKTPLHCQYWTSLRAEVYMNWMHSVGSVWKLKELLEEGVPSSEAGKEDKDMEAQPSGGENERSSKSKRSTTKGRHKRERRGVVKIHKMLGGSGKGDVRKNYWKVKMEGNSMEERKATEPPDRELCPSGGKVKKHSRGEFNFEATTAKMQALSYFDQHVVTYQCAMTVIEMLGSYSSGQYTRLHCAICSWASVTTPHLILCIAGSSNYLPVQEHVAFLFDLMELALNIYGLIDFCIQVHTT